ncbi:MAG: acyl-CoA dehydrogenase family protein [Myxococcota bacterium]
MDLSYSQEYRSFRDQVRAFLDDGWPLAGTDGTPPRSEQVALFRRRAIERGYLGRSVPRQYGGSGQEPDALKATIIREEFARAKAPADVRGIGPSMLVPTLLEKGTEWQKDKFVPPTVRGEVIWCQGYSEPGSGSDLASLQTKGELVGDEWVINGQKIWTSGAQHADYMFCLTRTEPDAPKHAGISYLLIDMKQPGIDVQPLRQITGAATFNQVFLTDVRTPADWIVGKRGEGWLVSRSTLKHERNSIGNAAQSLHLFGRLVELAQRVKINGAPAIEDIAIRQRLIEIEGYVRAHEYSGYRQLTRSANERPPGAVGLMNKLVGTNISQEIGKLAYDLIGDVGLTEPRDYIGRESPERGWIGQWMGSLGGAIAGGTANIQRNIIAERGLGLPRDAAAQRS